MDVSKMIQQLKDEKQRIDRAIAELEELQGTTDGTTGTLPKKRRGRKSMDPEERRQVSERMKKYWAKRQRSA